MPESFFLRQLISGGGTVWTQMAVVAALFAAVIFRPERIRRMGLFRLACVLVALSIIVPPLLDLLVGWVLGVSGWGPGVGSVNPRGVPGSFESQFLLGVSTVLGPLCLGLAVLFGLLALLPAAGHDDSLPPPKHPLE